MTTTRLFLLCHAPTAATRDGRFPAPDDVPDLRRDPPPVRAAVALHAPDAASRATAARSGLPVRETEALREPGWGAWSGQTVTEVAAADPAGFAAWLRNPDHLAGGHGDALRGVLERVASWLDSGVPSGRVLAVAGPTVVRCAILHALLAPPAGFWRVDVPPWSVTELTRAPGGTWRLRMATPAGAGPADEGVEG